VQGKLHGKPMRKSLDIRSWEAAQKMVRDWEARQLGAGLSVKEALARFVADGEARGIGAAQMGKYRLLERELTAQFGNMPVNGISVDELSKYRESWELSGISSQKKVERLRTFFRFCMDRNWCEKNPASKLSLPMFIRPQVQPFSDDEMGKILESVERYPDRPPGRRNEVRAFVSVIRSSGLRLGTW
jgi:hypothetical protein